MVTPYFRVQKSAGGFALDGPPSCCLGNELPGDPGERPAGVFLRWNWDGRQLLVENSQEGFYPLFYFADDTRICVSPSIVLLLAQGAPAELDDAALSVFLRLGFYLAEDTPFRAIRALPPNARLEWTDGRLKVSGGLTIHKKLDIRRREAIDGYISLFRAAMRRRLPPTDGFTVPLSGGRDSRHILLELVHAGYKPPFCPTVKYFPPRNNEDVRVAALLAERLDVRHVLLEQAAPQFAVELRKNATTGFLTDEHQWTFILADYLRGKAQYIYDGIAGDVLSAGLFQTPELHALMEVGKFMEVAQTLYSQPAGLKIVAGQKRFNMEMALHRIVEELKRHADAPSPIGSFYFWNRTRREIGLVPYCIFQPVGQIFAPYLDRDLRDFLASLPATMFLDFHTDTICEAYPEYADIPYEVKGWEVRDSAFFRRFAWDMALYLLRGSTDLVRLRYALPRLLRCLLDREYSSAASWMGPFLVYLLQLGRLTSGGTEVDSQKLAEASAILGSK